MKFKKAYLLNRNDEVISVLYVTDEQWSHSLSGIVYAVSSWNGDDMTPLFPMEASFIGSFTIKFDGCSHWSFFGEDTPAKKDSYYHLCGLTSYYKHFISQIFAFECAKRWTESKDMDDEVYGSIDRIDLEKTGFKIQTFDELTAEDLMQLELYNTKYE